MRKKDGPSATFSEYEWAFHKVKKNELRYCAQWELARLCGKKEKPWLKLTKAAKRRFIYSDQGSLKELDAAAGEVLRPWLKISLPAVKMITLVVDFREDQSVLLKLFENWLESSPYRKRFQRDSANRWRSLLSKIVILRAAEAGLSRKAAIQKTAELWRQWKLNGATEGILSAPHWSRALREAKALRRPLQSDKGHLLIGDPPFDDAKPSPFFLVSLVKVPGSTKMRRLRITKSKL